MTIGPAKLLIFWDYDTQWGADRSRNPSRGSDWGALEFPNTDRVLEAHARYDIPSCFAVVGAAALPGDRPYHDPAQIRRIHEAGHEVGSHSFRHDWLPALGPDELRETLSSSKDAIEQCIGAPVTTFVPPFNQPFDYARGWSFSMSERRSVPRNRTDLGRVCRTLADLGYRHCRVSYRELSVRVAERVRGRELYRPRDPATIAGIRCLRLNTPGGFSAELRDTIEASLDKGGYWVLYGHPHSTSDDTSTQSLQLLHAMLEAADGWRRAGRVECIRPCDLIDR